MAPRRRFGPWLLGIAAAFFFLVLPLIGWLARVWTDYLWYVDLGQQQVFVTRIVSQLVIGAAFSVVSFAFLYVNLRIARRLAPPAFEVILPDGAPPQLHDWIDRTRLTMSPILDRVILWGAIFLAYSTGASVAAEWTTLRLALARVPFGIDDPQFGVDIGFFVFTLPALEVVASWLGGLLVLTTILTALVHLIDGAIRPWEKLRGFAPHVKAHLSVLFAAIVLSQAFNYWLDIWNLNYSPRGQVIGASYTDVTAQLPAYRILIVISIATAVLLLANIRYRGWRLPGIALGIWIAASIVLGAVWPGLVQRFVVAPNEATRETPYIRKNIRMTREAFDLADVEGKPFPAAENLTAPDVIASRVTLQNVRLWDPAIVQQGYTQLQSIRPYYDFNDVDVDRYAYDGRMRQVLISAREMNSEQLAEQAQTWVNRHLVYTHGFGVVMSPVSESDARGLPRFVIGDVPPAVSADASASPELQTTQPRIYFGEKTTDYVVVDAGIDEFDYPLGDKNATYRFTAKTGVEVGSLARRIAWAIRLGSSQVLFSEYIGPQSRVLLRRDLESRLNEIAPWLVFDDDPYPVLVDGRIFWVVDAYTASTQFPYAQTVGAGTNYLRNSVKVVVDAYSGQTTFYAFDPEEPVLKAWSKVFPEMMADGSQIPEGIRKHFRYPQRLFEAQAEIYRTYHMTDATVFYNKEDQWEIPGERQGAPMQPFFVLLKLPGAEQEHFYLMQPYTPRNRDNMIGWMAVSSDPGNYGERTVYQFPKERVILGPEQVGARINQDPAISPQLSLWNQRGSQAIFGNMLVIPIKDSIVYIQPLYLQAEQTAIPELTRVIVVYADKVEMARTLEAALLRIFGEAPAEETTGTPGPGGTRADAATAQRLYREAVEAQRKGDWATYGQKLQALGEVLSRLAGAEATATP